MPTLLSSSNSTMNSNNGPNPQQKYKVNEKVIVRCSEPGENDGYFDYEAIVVAYNANDGTYDIVFSYDNKRDTGVKEDVMKNFEDLKIEFKDYYFSNVIAKASKTMLDCNNSKIDIKRTGTEG